MPSRIHHAVLFFFGLLQLCLAADYSDYESKFVTFRTKLGDFTLLKEKDPYKYGYTWVGRVKLIEEHQRYPTVEIAEDYAKEAYRAIVKDPSRRIMDNGQDKYRDRNLFGDGKSTDFLVSAYTYHRSPYVWISSLPRGGGQTLAKARINGGFRDEISDGDRRKSAALLRRALRKVPVPDDYVDSYIHAEEAAFAAFETDIIFQPYGDQTQYPGGSVVGSWHRGTTRDKDKALRGSAKTACSEEPQDAMTVAFKRQDACSIVTRRLGVEAALPRSSSSRGGGSSRNCRRADGTAANNGSQGDAGDDDGAVCLLPDPKGTSTNKAAASTGKPTGKAGASHGLRPTAVGNKGTRPAGANHATGPTGAVDKGAGSSHRVRPTGAVADKGAVPTTMKTVRGKASAADVKTQKAKQAPGNNALLKPTKTAQGRPAGTSKAPAKKTGTGKSRAGAA